MACSCSPSCQWDRAVFPCSCGGLGDSFRRKWRSAAATQVMESTADDRKTGQASLQGVWLVCSRRHAVRKPLQLISPDAGEPRPLGDRTIAQRRRQSFQQFQRIRFFEGKVQVDLNERGEISCLKLSTTREVMSRQTRAFREGGSHSTTSSPRLPTNPTPSTHFSQRRIISRI